jgi:hypothetical protein
MNIFRGIDIIVISGSDKPFACSYAKSEFLEQIQLSILHSVIVMNRSSSKMINTLQPEVRS